MHAQEMIASRSSMLMLMLMPEICRLIADLISYVYCHVVAFVRNSSSSMCMATYLSRYLLWCSRLRQHFQHQDSILLR